MDQAKSDETKRIEKKFYEEVTHQPLKPSIKERAEGFIRDQPIFCTGLFIASLLGIRGYRKGKTLPSYYPKNIYVLDVRLQVCGTIIMGIFASAAYELYLIRKEGRHKLPRKSPSYLQNQPPPDGKDT